jgi:hypothetical protein
MAEIGSWQRPSYCTLRSVLGAHWLLTSPRSSSSDCFLVLEHLVRSLSLEGMTPTLRSVHCADGCSICADVFGSPLSRGRAMALFMATTTFGPCAGPVISGYVTPTSWRWSFWAGLILTAPGWIMLSLSRETYGPVLLKRRAEKLRKETGNMNIVAPAELEPRDLRHIIMVVLTRPIRMICFEGKAASVPHLGLRIDSIVQHLWVSRASTCPWFMPSSTSFSKRFPSSSVVSSSSVMENDLS